ncbi:glycosyltransferase [Streptomonospora litoralis]|uniref:Glycosyl transferases group 1 n=1 Tax=Streptomonospora litoralis TaxID=2498135 RepID=A0A4P6Q1P4_9ACTN|nr:glycosyltransferase [Streptomonospora litoralis]QBI54508.1 Glycosyl transferases group 1 [Streptomonospora litoralis]
MTLQQQLTTAQHDGPPAPSLRILLWHVHGSWTTSFVQGRHRCLLPADADRGPDGRGRADTWTWPANAVEVAPEHLAAEPVDAVVLQRPHELELAQRWLGGRRPGRDVPAVYVEHNAPQGDVPRTRHPLAERSDIPVVHVTHFNELFWDCGRAPTAVVEHGVVDPGHRYTGEVERAGVVINEPLRRGRVTGTDLLPRFAGAAPLDLFGMGVADAPAALGLSAEQLRPYDDLPQHRLHAELARRRVYLHPLRWTSLGLSLIEAMLLGMPVLALAATEAREAIPPDAGLATTGVDALCRALRELLCDPARAAECGRAARAAALRRYSIDRFLGDWDRLLQEVTR